MFGEQYVSNGEDCGASAMAMRDPREARDSVSEEIREIDRALRRIARRQATLDVDLLAWLRRAEDENIWPKLGYVHALEYLEEVFAFAPRTAIDRLRVANELGDLPQIEKALAAGELAYGAVRELTRVATAETEGAWLAEARGKRLRDVERMVAGRKKGDAPDAKPDPNRIRHGLWLELDGEAMAAWRQMRAMLDDELGEKLDDRMVVLEVARRCLAGDLAGGGIDGSADGGIDRACRSHEDCDGSHESDVPHEPGASAEPQAERHREVMKRSPRPMQMQHSIRCPDCRRGWQLGAGEAIEISATALAEIECDAVIVDDENGGRAAWTIPPATRRKVIMRDHGRCQVPGCRAARFLAVHHIVHREDGGTNDEWNLIVLCFGHHKLHHDGILEMSGRAPDRVRFVRNGVELPPAGGLPAHIELLGDRREEREAVRLRRVANQNVELATVALETLGFTAREAKRAVEAACVHGGAETLEGLLKQALRQC